MELKPALKNLENDKSFRSWRKSNKNDYLSYAFKILMEGKDEDWQFGFYSKKKNTITTFVIEGNKICIRKDEEIFKREEDEVEEININDVKLNLNEIMKITQDYEKKNYPREKNLKIIAILQKIEKLGTIWNITFITESFNTLNIKVDSSDGKILEHRLEQIISFGK